MNRLARLATVVATLSLPLLLADCSSFDPTDIMDNMFASQKKPLAGDRKPLFPTGTPGVSQGLPPELVKGYQPPPPQTDATQDAQAAVPEKPKPKPKPKPKVVAAPPANQSNQPAAMSVPASTRPAAGASPWPDPPPTRQSAAPANGGSIWPDPPAPTVTR
jgi:hypothetical protein